MWSLTRTSCFVALCAAAAGCATGHARADATSATLGSERTLIENIDERNVRGDGAEASNARFELPPGRHSVEVSLEKAPATSRRRDESAQGIAVCFAAVAGHSYRTRPVFGAGRWHPEIVDESIGATVSSGCADTGAELAVQPAATVASVQLDENSRPASLPVPSRPASRDSTLPGTGVTAGVGFFFGGETLYTVTFTNAPERSLSAGRGVLVTVGGQWTPLWIDDQFGFGAGAALGWKYDSIEASNGTVSLRRFPLDLTVHSVIRVNSHWFALLSGGATKELANEVSGNGFAATASAAITSTWGLLGEGGFYYTVEHATFGAALRYSKAHDWFQGIEFDASSFGFIASGQYGF
jgi:hypothetical protein